MKKSSLTILACVFFFSTIFANGPSNWPFFHPNYGQSNLALPDWLGCMWQTDLGDSVEISPTTSPITGWLNGQEVVYVATSNGLYCLSSDSGNIIWHYQTSRPLSYAPLYWTENKLYFSMNDSLICLDSRTGQKIWGYQLRGQGFHPVGLGNYIGVIDATSRVYLFDNLTQRIVWQTGPLSNAGCDNTSLILDNQGYVYVVTLGDPLSYYDFRICKLNLRSGQIVWQWDELAFEPGGVRMTPGLRFDSLLCFGTHSMSVWGSSVYNYRTSNHQLFWQHGFVHSEGPAMASPGISARGYTYFPTVNKLLCFDDSNNYYWQYDCAFHASSPAIDRNGKIVIGTANADPRAGRLTILSPEGLILDEWQLTGDLTSPAIGADSLGNNVAIYIANDRGMVYKFGDIVVGQSELKTIFDGNKLIICPNPFGRQLKIISSSEVEIYLLNGQKVFSHQAGVLFWQAEQLPRGVYWVKNHEQVIKVIKE